MSELMLTPVFSVSEQRVIRRAMRLLEKYQRNPGESFLSSDATKTWLQLHLARQEREMFVVLYLDNQNRLLEHETLFLGTINSTEVHPREIMKSALRHNAAAVILAHNHPSGVAEPSRADRLITTNIVKTLDLVKVRVLDHFIIGAGGCPLFCRTGLAVMLQKDKVMQQEWGLPCTVTPRFTARLVQERHNLHYLADRAAITGKFSSPDLLHIDQAFPVLMKQLELKLADGELSPANNVPSRYTPKD